MLVLGILWYAVFVASATLHEAAHAFVGFKLGDKTAFHGGQVTLNPIPHHARADRDDRNPVGFLRGGRMDDGLGQCPV